MKKSNVILQAAIASALLAMAGSAYATASVTATARAYATEQFSGTNSATATIVAGGAISIVSGTAIPGGSTITAVLELTGGTFAAMPVLSYIGSGGLTSVPAPASTLAATTTVNVGAGAATATANNANVFQNQMTYIASSVGLGGTVLTIAAPTINASTLATAAGTITAKATIYQGAVTAAVGAAYTATAVDATSAAVTLATSSAGSTISVAANTSTSQIDLTATTASTLFTSVAASATETGSTTIYKLGRLYLKDNGTYQRDGATTYTVLQSAPAITATIAAPAGFFAGLGSTGVVTLKNASQVGGTDNACANATNSATSTARTLAQTAADTSETLTGAAMAGGTAGSGWPYDVCYTISGTVAQIEGTPTLAVSLGTAGTYTSVTTLAATNLQQLVRNGQTYNVRNYVPAAATGYTTFLRVINTGTLSAAVSVALIDDVTGTVGTSGVLGTVAAGAATNFTPAQIEAVTGAIAATSRPRLRITAPTNALNVQTFLALPSGDITDMTGAQ